MSIIIINFLLEKVNDLIKKLKKAKILTVRISTI